MTSKVCLPACCSSRSAACSRMACLLVQCQRVCCGALFTWRQRCCATLSRAPQVRSITASLLVEAGSLTIVAALPADDRLHLAALCAVFLLLLAGHAIRTVPDARSRSADVRPASCFWVTLSVCRSSSAFLLRADCHVCGHDCADDGRVRGVHAARRPL